MVGGPNFETKPFNLATLGHRQPGSSIKPFILLTALEEGISPETAYESAPQEFHFGKNGQETFVVNNDEDAYLGVCSIVCATTYSDNSVYAQLALEGLKGKTSRTAPARSPRRSTRWATATRSRPTPRWSWAASKEGVTPLGWTYAYSTLANNGDRVSGTLRPDPGDSPVAYTQVTDQDGQTIKGGDNDSTPQTGARRKHRRRSQEHPRNRRQQRHRAQRRHRRRGPVGQDRHDRENGDAWFCGATEEVTACVWVGYADTVTPMTTLYNGGPVMGGTFPALIWASVISAWEEIKAERAAEAASEKASKSHGSGSTSRRAEGEEEAMRAPESSTEPAPSPKNRKPRRNPKPPRKPNRPRRKRPLKPHPNRAAPAAAITAG